MKPLSRVKVLDLTHRLPGPLAGKLLADQGAEVVKVEDSVLKDAFLEGFFATFDNSFVDWYHGLNDTKKIVRLDFKAADIQTQMKTWVDWAEVILLGLSDKMALRMGFGPEELAKLSGPKVVLTLAASKQNKTAMHDLNALADTGLLDMHVAGQTQSPLPPPFLPTAGIAFGQQVALSALAHLTQARALRCCLISKVFMQEEIESVFLPFWSHNLRAQPRTKFLHNGAYPCYCLYKTRDGDWIAVAAVEEKFWRSFVENLGLQLTDEERFSREDTIFQTVAKEISTRTSAELTDLLVNKDICVSLVRHRD